MFRVTLHTFGKLAPQTPCRGDNIASTYTQGEQTSQEKFVRAHNKPSIRPAMSAKIGALTASERHAHPQPQGNNLTSEQRRTHTCWMFSVASVQKSRFRERSRHATASFVPHFSAAHNKVPANFPHLFFFHERIAAQSAA